MQMQNTSPDPYQIALSTPGFLEKVLAKAVREGSCLIWQGEIIKQTGYGRIIIFDNGRRRNLTPHRLVCIAQYGPLSRSVLACHSCDNRRCIEPTHIRPGSHLDNSREAVERGRVARGKGLPQTKRTEDEVHAIRSDPRSYSLIAQAYNTTSSSVSNIKNLKE